MYSLCICTCIVAQCKRKITYRSMPTLFLAKKEGWLAEVTMHNISHVLHDDKIKDQQGGDD